MGGLAPGGHGPVLTNVMMGISALIIGTLIDPLAGLVVHRTEFVLNQMNDHKGGAALFGVLRNYLVDLGQGFGT